MVLSLPLQRVVQKRDTTLWCGYHVTLPLQKQKLGTKTGPHGGKQTHRAGLRTAVFHDVFEHNQH